MGVPLDWRGLAASGLQTKRTKVVGPRVVIGDRTEPSAEGMQELAQEARRLIDAVKPYLQDVYAAATSMGERDDTTTTALGAPSLG
jgi:hypothetical protein